ncbi:MAG: hypothetical protein ACI8UP_001665, partial [Porticoccaceae bacterium]
RIGLVGLVAALGGVLLFNIVFEWMHRVGGRFDRRKSNGSSECDA